MTQVRPVVNGKLVRAAVYISLFGILIPLLMALIMAHLLVWPDLTKGIPWLNFGRLRVFHTNGVIYGWLGISFLAILNYIIPKLSNRPLISEKLAWGGLIFWTLGVAVGLVGILTGHMEGIEYAEMPWYADLLFVIGYVMASTSYLGTIFASREKNLYVSQWYFILGLTFTALNFIMANTIPMYVAPGAAGAAITGLWIHNAVGLFITPIGVGIVYYMLPVLLRKPIYSHLLSLVGFWTLAFFYPLGGSHHYFFSPIPWWTQILAVPLTAVLFVVVVTVVYNWIMTLKGDWYQIPRNPALAFIVTGIFAYMATCTQGPFHTLLTVQKVIHFTDWVVAHAHLALLGAFTFFNIGSILYIWPKVTRRKLYNPKLSWVSYWLLVLGFYVFYFLPITAAGLVQGYTWISLAPFADSVIHSKPFWFTRVIGGYLIYTSLVIFAYQIVMTVRKGEWIEEGEVEAVTKESVLHAKLYQH